MGDFLQKIGPVAVVAVVFAWCCWPYLDGSANATGSKGGGDACRLAKNLLSPLVKEGSDRNPFEVLQAAHNLLKNPLAESVATGPGGGPAGNATGTPGEASNGASSLTLTGTLLQGDLRMAIIGGKIYRTGETLNPQGAGEKPWTVKEISTNQVILQRGSETKVVTYPARSASPTANSHGNRGEQDAGAGDPSKDASSAAASGGDPTPVTSLSDLIRAVEASQKP